jgi:hypothetical protein
MTHRLFRFRQASHGRSFRVRVLDASPLAMLLILAETLSFVFSLPGASILGLVGLAAMAIGAVRAITVGVDMA